MSVTYKEGAIHVSDGEREIKLSKEDALMVSRLSGVGLSPGEGVAPVRGETWLPTENDFRQFTGCTPAEFLGRWESVIRDRSPTAVDTFRAAMRLREQAANAANSPR